MAWALASSHSIPSITPDAQIRIFLRIGLLLPAEVCRAALDAYRQGAGPLPALGGHPADSGLARACARHLPAADACLSQSNFFDANRLLPAFYWTAETNLKCPLWAVAASRRNAYAHHIQRQLFPAFNLRIPPRADFAIFRLLGVDPAQPVIYRRSRRSKPPHRRSI